MKNIDITIEHSKIHKEEYSFYLSDFKAYLDTYKNLYRETPRHGWKVKTEYSRLFKRGSLKESDVIIPEDIKTKIIEELTNRIEVLKWNER